MSGVTDHSHGLPSPWHLAMASSLAQNCNDVPPTADYTQGQNISWTWRNAGRHFNTLGVLLSKEIPLHLPPHCLEFPACFTLPAPDRSDAGTCHWQKGPWKHGTGWH